MCFFVLHRASVVLPHLPNQNIARRRTSLSVDCNLTKTSRLMDKVAEKRALQETFQATRGTASEGLGAVAIHNPSLTRWTWPPYLRLRVGFGDFGRFADIGSSYSTSSERLTRIVVGASTPIATVPDPFTFTTVTVMLSPITIFSPCRRESTNMMVASVSRCKRYDRGQSYTLGLVPNERKTFGF